MDGNVRNIFVLFGFFPSSNNNGRESQSVTLTHETKSSDGHFNLHARKISMSRVGLSFFSDNDLYNLLRATSLRPSGRSSGNLR